METETMTPEQARDKGIKRSYDHAEDAEPGWKDQALEMVRDYPDETFMTEDVRKFASQQGLADPPDDRAWGGVMKRAAKQGIIVAEGYAQTKGKAGHKRPGTVWRKVEA